MNEIKTVNGKMIQVLRSVRQGGGHVAVEVQRLKKVDNGFIPIGEPVEAFGGFKREKDFNYKIAESVAFQNAVSHMRD